MYLWASQRACPLPRPRTALQGLSFPLTCLLCPSFHLHRMRLMRIVRRACAVLPFPGRLLVIYLVLDLFYLACVYETASLPVPGKRGNASESLNRSMGSLSDKSSLTTPLMLASQMAAPPASLLPLSSSSLSSSSSFSSRLVDEKHGGNISYNGSDISLTDSDVADNASRGGDTPHVDGQGRNDKQAVSSPRAGKARKEFPLALVVASATAAISILLFFCLSYLWHTRQLDRRAQKLAIRLAAEADNDMNCSKCRTVPPYRPGSSQDSGSDSGGEECRVLPVLPTALDELNSLNEEDEEAEGEDGSRRKPGGVGRTLGTKKGGKGRGAKRSGSRSSRKWSGHSSGQARSSLVTDQEILNHFASRRHSTFFI